MIFPIGGQDDLEIPRLQIGNARFLRWAVPPSRTIRAVDNDTLKALVT